MCPCNLLAKRREQWFFAGMFIDTIPNRTSPPAILLRESYREGRKVKKRTLANLSKLPQALIDGIASLIAHGKVAAVGGMIRKLGLGRTLQGRTQVERRVRDLIEAMIIQRIIAPGSKLAFHRALAPETATSSLALSVGLMDVAEREVYAALDWLIEQQPRIEAALASKHLVPMHRSLRPGATFVRSYWRDYCSDVATPPPWCEHVPPW